MNYRNEARNYLKLSKEELATGDSERLQYAALELRMAMEALTYDRALAYKDDFPPDEYETWQPVKVMSVLLDIDPNADTGSSLAVGLEETPGVPASVMTPMGSEKVLNMATLKKHYSALGSHLHVQSMKQVRNRISLDFNERRSRCEKIASFVEEALSSSVHNLVFSNFSMITCVVCGVAIRKRLRDGQSEVSVECYDCHASYTLVAKEDGQVDGGRTTMKLNAGTRTVRKKSLSGKRIWKSENAGYVTTCKGRNTFALGVIYEPEGSWNEST